MKLQTDEIETEKATTEKKDYIKTTHAKYYMSEFLADIQSDKGEIAIPTGFDKLDDAIGGGLYAGLYCLGAVSSLGKTTFTLQLADQIAENRRDVLIISLEMAKRELLAKSISRQYYKTNKDNNCNITTRSILSCTYPKDYKNKLIEAFGEYENIADHIFILEGAGDVSASRIQKILKEHNKVTGNTPIVIIDYLQLLSPISDRLSDKMNMDASVKVLKQISRDFKIPVIAISSFNRGAYTKEAAMTSFKESGNIEYSADVLLSLQYSIQDDKTTEQAQLKEKAKDIIDIDLVVLKSRNSTPGSIVKFKFKPKYNLFYSA